MENSPETVLLTGASGFLGSQIAETLIANNFRLIATKRQSTSLWRCEAYENRIDWVDIDQANWIQEIIKSSPGIIIHTAWVGVTASERMNWSNQLTNIMLVNDLLTITSQVRPRVFIGFGSQAEYGAFEGKINEEYPTSPNTAYATVKVMVYELLKGYFRCVSPGATRWYWLRLFSFYGEKEGDDWLIPSAIHKMLLNEEMLLTHGKQKYAYLYVKDLADRLLQLIDSNAASGIYNISSENPVSIKDLLLKIAAITNSKSILNFGALEYRANQPMYIEGDMRKFRENVGQYTERSFDEGLSSVINYMKLSNRK